MRFDDFLHILFPCFLSFVVLIRVTIIWMQKRSALQEFVFSEYYYPMILFPCSTICVMCGIGGGIILFPIMMLIFDDKGHAAAISAFTSLVLSSCSLLLTLFYPSTYQLYPVIYADIFLPLLLCAVIISPYFTMLGSWINKNLSAKMLDVSLLGLTFVIIFWQIITL